MLVANLEKFKQKLEEQIDLLKKEVVELTKSKDILLNEISDQRR